MSKLNLFDCLNAITFLKEDLTDRDDFDKVYNQFMINKFLAMVPEYCELAKQLTVRRLSNKDHFLLLLRFLPKKKIYFNYQKKERGVDYEEVNIVQRYYQVSYNKACEIVRLLTEEQIENIKKSFGGKRQ